MENDSRHILSIFFLINYIVYKKVKMFVKRILTKCFYRFVSVLLWRGVEIVLLYWKEVPEGRRIFLCCILGYSVPKPQARLFPQLSWKSREKRALSKNFSVILSVCWFTNWIRRIVTSDSIGPFWHIFFSNFNAVWQMKNFWLTPFLTTSSRTWF